jgi:epoxide hydrolase-like predicted phosphatase
VIDAVVFDLGGVFTESPFEALRAAGAARGATFEEALEIVFGSYDEDTDHPWHRAERGELDLETCRAEIRALAAARGFELDLYDLLAHLSTDGGVREEVVERARSLRAGGYRTALVTNNVAEFREFWRPLLPLDELFEVVVDSSEVGVRKPDPRIFALVLERLGGVAPSRSVLLDDYPGNVAAARRLGWHGILVEPDPAGALAELDRLLAGEAPTPR